jgi:hypothetical protein
VSEMIRTDAVRFVKELYPRLKPHDDVIERYRDAIDNLPPIIVARGGVLVDGYHRWQAHVREGADTIVVDDLGDLSDSEILRESYRRNATHGEQMSKREKIAAAEHLYLNGGGTEDERYALIAETLSLKVDVAKKYCAQARQTEKRKQEEQAWDLNLDCVPQVEIAERLGIAQPTLSRWISIREQSSEMNTPPESRQHFDVWQFQTSDKDSGQQSYFGAVPPQVMENLLWFYTEPGDAVVDLFAGSGTTVDVAKAMGRRVWAADIRGNHYSPHLPIHQHDVTTGWPEAAPRKANLVFLDPPYWQQAAGRYSTEPGEMAEMELGNFYGAWSTVAKACMEHAERIAYIISPTQDDDGSVVDHATDMLGPFLDEGWTVERRIIVPYSTQQATGQQVTWARENKRMLKLYRDLVVLTA